MKEKMITKRILIPSIIFIVSLFSSCDAQNNKDNQEFDSAKLEVKIINVLPVGWGFKYKATTEKIVEGGTEFFNDTIIFGITASKEYENINIGDTCLITLKNSREISKTTYLPPITGTVSKQNEIWLITKIEKRRN